jgi:hypothetical protein
LHERVFLFHSRAISANSCQPRMTRVGGTIQRAPESAQFARDFAQRVSAVGAMNTRPAPIHVRARASHISPGWRELRVSFNS